MISKLAVHYINSSLLVRSCFIKIDTNKGVVEAHKFIRDNKQLLLDIYLECHHCFDYKLTRKDFSSAITLFVADISILINQVEPLQEDSMMKPTQEQSDEFDKLCESILEEYNV